MYKMSDDIPPENPQPGAPCGHIHNWKWEKGELHNDTTIKGNQLQRSYFDCATYYYDGVFNVVKFPKGMTIYTGSGNLVNANVEFPIGRDFYTPFDMSPGTSSIPLKQFDPINQNRSIESLISDSFDISPGWFGDPETAKIYSADPGASKFSQVCGKKCVCAYTFRQDMVMYLLDDAYNIAKLYSSSDAKVAPKIKEAISRMFNITDPTPVRTDSEDPFQRFKYTKSRFSARDIDLYFSKWACTNIVSPQNYGGYCATYQHSTFHGGTFHLEFILCNATKWIKRDLDNPIDWQHNATPQPPEYAKYMKQISLYKTANVNFHAGNLTEHSVWTLLYAEKMLKEVPTGLEASIMRLVGFTAFIHDIGKVAPNANGVKVNTIRKQFVYFDIKEHPTIGSDYLLGHVQFPMLHTDLSTDTTNQLNMKKLFEEFGCVYNPVHVVFVATIIELHWIFGSDVVRVYNERGKTDALFNDLMVKYIKTVWKVFAKYYPLSSDRKDEERKMVYLSTLVGVIVVSTADVLGSQAYGIGALERGVSGELNKRSELFPFISNLPKKYRGSNLGEISNIWNLGARAIRDCNAFIKSMSLDAFNSYFE